MTDVELTPEVIRDMAKLAVLANRISPFHEINLKRYALIFFDGVKSAKIDYDFSHKKTTDTEGEVCNSLITYYLHIDEKEPNSHIDKRFQALEQSVRSLFWKDTTVEVYFNDRIMYKSKKNVGN